MGILGKRVMGLTSRLVHSITKNKVKLDPICRRAEKATKGILDIYCKDKKDTARSITGLYSFVICH